MEVMIWLSIILNFVLVCMALNKPTKIVREEIDHRSIEYLIDSVVFDKVSGEVYSILYSSECTKNIIKAINEYQLEK